jgi:hypothetical protein
MIVGEYYRWDFSNSSELPQLIHLTTEEVEMYMNPPNSTFSFPLNQETRFVETDETEQAQEQAAAAAPSSPTTTATKADFIIRSMMTSVMY